ncbi:tyrosine-protein phosphatase [Rhizocola hellebori]|uniref:tyrosine-protein phosphatase n=1 Tax=Rhizocola hellebori TaxID=1392758 RepID=UPI0019422664
MRMFWPDCVNARDLGGLPTATGGRTRMGALFRSDNHNRLTPQGIRAITESGVSRILDLRWNWEARRGRQLSAGRWRHP